MMKTKNVIYIFLFLLSCSASFAQVNFEAKVSKKRLGINERLRVDFEMNQDGDNFVPPGFEGFRVVGGPNQSISNSWINGNRSYSKTYSYFLAPQSKGNFTIGQASIEINGAIYKSPPISIEVTSAVDIPRDGNNADYLASENVHLVAEISNTNPYLNEAITVVYKLYVSNEVSITSNWREIDSPKYADFWSQNIDNQGNFKIYEGKYKGEDYRYVILRTSILYPQKTGELNIEPLVLDVPIDVRSNKRDFIGRFLMTRVNKTISAGNSVIDVKPLPQNGKPDNFSGAVGNFKFDVTTSKTQLDANESLELIVRISGTGNLKLFDLPKVSLPSSLEVYEPIRDDNIKTQVSGMTGSVAENYTVVPQLKGTYPIRPITFTYFDPKSETYKAITSEEILIEVENGPLTATVNADQANQKQEIAADTDQFKYIKLEPDLESMEQEPFFKSSIFWSLIGLPLAVIPLFILIGRKRRLRMADLEGNKLRRVNQLAKKYLGEAKKNLAHKELFYESLERALHNYLKAKLLLETSDMAKEHISRLLQEHQVEQDTVNSLIGLLKSCEFARYAGTSGGSIQSDYNNAVELLAVIDKQFR